MFLIGLKVKEKLLKVHLHSAVIKTGCNVYHCSVTKTILVLLGPHKNNKSKQQLQTGKRRTAKEPQRGVPVTPAVVMTGM